MAVVGIHLSGTAPRAENPPEDPSPAIRQYMLDVERRFTKDQLLTTISLYWFTQTIGSSIRLYYESDYRRECGWQVPTAHLMSSKDMFPTPREWMERVSQVDRWTEVGRGGHFMEWEERALVAQDMRAFFGPLRPSSVRG